MPPGEVAADWRQKRLAVRVRFKPGSLFPGGVRFLDVESPETREVLRVELAEILAYFGYEDMDVATVRAQDRRITRYISRWAFDARDDDGNPKYAGVRYLSRLDSAWECWAVFHDVEIEEISRHSILPGDEDLCRVAKRYGLRVF
jgi:RES domain